MPRNRLLLSCALTLVMLALPASAQAQTVEVPAVARGCDEARVGPDEKVLVFSETTAFRHDSIPAGRQAICELAGRDGIAVDWTEDSAVFTADALAQYDAVVFLSTTGDPLDDTQQAAFEDYIRTGGGYAGIHAASDTEYDWPWYGGLVGAYFDSHPAIQDATVEVSDRKHPSTARLPQRWQRDGRVVQLPVQPARRRARARHAGGDELRARRRRDGRRPPDRVVPELRRRALVVHGRRPHDEAYGETAFRRHLLGGIKWAANLVAGECGGTEWGNFERMTLAKGAAETGEPIGLAVLPDRSVLHTSRDGVVRYTDATGATKVAATIPVYNHDEDGLQAIRLDPGFATNRWVYVYYAPPLSTPAGDAPFDGTPEQFAAFKGVNRLSRFKWDPAASSSTSRASRSCSRSTRTAASAATTAATSRGTPPGNLYLSTGDDTNPFESQGSAPIDERATRNPAFDAQRSSANTNDLRGKILRIKPTP